MTDPDRQLPTFNVVMFERHRVPGRHSIERVSDNIRIFFPPDVSVRTHVMPYESRGFTNLVRNLLFARRHRGHVHHITGDVHYLALALPGRSTLMTVHDLVSLQRLKGLRRMVYSLFWYRLPAWKVARISVVSEWTRAELVNLLPQYQDKIVVIHNAVHPSLATTTPNSTGQEFSILQVGTGPNKNILRVIDALHGLPLHLRIVGKLTPEQLDRLQDRATRFSNVVAVDDLAMAEEYARCDILLFVSTYEGFGLPIIEAQSAGRPVITSRAASMPEVAGTGALLVNPLDVPEIRSAVVKLMDDRALREDLVRLGHENVKRFDATRIAGSYASVLRSLTGAPGAWPRR